MTSLEVVFAAITIIALLVDGVFLREVRAAHGQLKDTTLMFERMVGRLIDEAKAEHLAASEEREAARKERQELANRIQAPKDAPYLFDPELQEMAKTKQYISEGNEEEEFWRENGSE